MELQASIKMVEEIAALGLAIGRFLELAALTYPHLRSAGQSIAVVNTPGVPVAVQPTG